MQALSDEQQMERLEKKIDEGFARVDRGFAEMRVEFKAVRAEMRTEIRSAETGLRSEIGAARSDTRADFRTMFAGVFLLWAATVLAVVGVLVAQL